MPIQKNPSLQPGTSITKENNMKMKEAEIPIPHPKNPISKKILGAIGVIVIIILLCIGIFSTSNRDKLMEEALALYHSQYHSTADNDAARKLFIKATKFGKADAYYYLGKLDERIFDFDSAMILAVNHSGRSAAVGAVTGALLGARMGYEALPEFYLESLEPLHLLMELANDLVAGCAMEIGSSLFDDDWDRKYLRAGQ